MINYGNPYNDRKKWVSYCMLHKWIRIAYCWLNSLRFIIDIGENLSTKNNQPQKCLMFRKQEFVTWGALFLRICVNPCGTGSFMMIAFEGMND